MRVPAEEPVGLEAWGRRTAHELDELDTGMRGFDAGPFGAVAPNCTMTRTIDRT